MIWSLFERLVAAFVAKSTFGNSHIFNVMLGRPGFHPQLRVIHCANRPKARRQALQNTYKFY